LVDPHDPRDTSAADAEAVTAGPVKRVLFVDDDPEVLDGLRDALRRYRRAWSMRFAASGADALAQLEVEPADVIISDIQMPGMDGATLLCHVQERYPSTIRLVLSGYANTEYFARAATVAHRILAKPCNVDELALVVERSCALHGLTEQARVYRVAAATGTLPSCPGLYTAIMQAVSDSATGPDAIALIIERDAAMTAKLLQLANSAFFGIGRTVSRVRDAVIYLGTDTISALTLASEAMAKLAPAHMDGFSVEAFARHATLVARIAAGILPAGVAQQDAITAALVHDIGQLVMINDDRDQWQLLAAQARRRGLPLHEIEREVQGITHAAVGAYLLSLWGLPHGVVEAVAGHHDPASLAGSRLDAVAAVHIAAALAHEVEGEAPADVPAPQLDMSFVSHLGVEPDLEGWRELARSAAGVIAVAP
jgi:HD-like signal output (HDOD) protein/ActR/RegA family two-component response regulator